MGNQADTANRAGLARSFKIDDVVDNSYRIASEALPSLAGKLYKAYRCGEAERRPHLLLQLHSWVTCKQLPDAELPWQKLSSPELFVLDMKGMRLFEEVWQSKGREQIGELFSPVFSWLGQLHSTQHKKFPFLHYRNILWRDDNTVAVLGSALAYDYLRNPGTPYDYLMSPNYLNSLKFQQAQHNELDDYYALAVMVWESWRRQRPAWDAHTQKFSEPVAAGPYTSMVKAFVEGDYSHITDAGAMLQELARQPWDEDAPATGMTSPSSAAESTASEAGEDGWLREQIGQLEQDRQNMFREKQTLCREKEELYQQQEKLKAEFRQKITFTWAAVGVGIALPVLLVLGLYLYGFRLLAPDLWQNQQTWRAQKSFWHAVALCQSNQTGLAKQMCDSAARDGEYKLVYTYLKTLINVQSLAQESGDRQQRLRQAIARDLTLLKGKQDELARELAALQLPPTTVAALDQLHKVYGK